VPVSGRSSHSLRFNGVNDSLMIPQATFSKTGPPTNLGKNDSTLLGQTAGGEQDPTGRSTDFPIFSIEAWVKPDCGGIIASKEGSFQLKIGSISEPGPLTFNVVAVDESGLNQNITLTTALKESTKWSGLIFPRHNIETAHGSYNTFDSGKSEISALSINGRELLHVVAEIKPPFIKLYVNTEIVARHKMNDSLRIANTSNDLYIGGKGGEFRGDIEAFHIHAGPTNQLIEPSGCYASPASLGLWRFEEPVVAESTIFNSGALTAVSDGTTNSITISTTHAQSLISIITGAAYDATTNSSVTLTDAPYSQGSYDVADRVSTPGTDATIAIAHTPYNILFNPDCINRTTYVPNRKPPERLRLLGVNGTTGVLTVESIHLDFSSSNTFSSKPRRGILHNRTADVDDHFVLVAGDLLIDGGSGKPYQPPHFASQAIDRAGQMCVDESGTEQHGFVYSSQMDTYDSLDSAPTTRPFAVEWPNTLSSTLQLGHSGRHTLTAVDGHHYLRGYPNADRETITQSIDGTGDMVTLEFNASHSGLKDHVPLNSQIDVFHEAFKAAAIDVLDQGICYQIVTNGLSGDSVRKLLAIGGVSGSTEFDPRPFLLRAPMIENMSNVDADTRSTHLKPTDVRIAILEVSGLKAQGLAPYVEIHYNAVDLTGASMSLSAPCLLVDKVVPVETTVLGDGDTILDKIVTAVAAGAKITAPGGIVTLGIDSAQGDVHHIIDSHSLQGDDSGGSETEDIFDESRTPPNYTPSTDSDEPNVSPQLITSNDGASTTHESIHHQMVVNSQTSSLKGQLANVDELIVTRDPVIAKTGTGEADIGTAPTSTHVFETYDIIDNIAAISNEQLVALLVHPSDRNRTAQLRKIKTSRTLPGQEANTCSIHYYMSKARIKQIIESEGEDRRTTIEAIGIMNDLAQRNVDFEGRGSPDSHVVKEIMPGAPVVSVTLGGPGQGAINTKPTWDPSPLARLGWNTRRDCGAVISAIATGGAPGITVYPLNNDATDLASWGTYCFPKQGRVYTSGGASAYYNGKTGTAFTMGATTAIGNYIDEDGNDFASLALWVAATGLTVGDYLFIDKDFNEDSVCADGTTINDRLFQNQSGVNHDYQLGTQYASTRALAEIPLFPNLFFDNVDQGIFPGPDNSLKLTIDATHTAHTWAPNPVGPRCFDIDPSDPEVLNSHSIAYLKGEAIKASRVTKIVESASNTIDIYVDNPNIFVGSIEGEAVDIAGRDFALRVHRAFLPDGESVLYQSVHSDGYLVVPDAWSKFAFSRNFISNAKGSAIFPAPSRYEEALTPLRDHPIIDSVALEVRKHYYYDRSNVQTQGGNVDYGLRQYVSAVEFRAGPRTNPHLPHVKVKRGTAKVVTFTSGTLVVEDASELPTGHAEGDYSGYQFELIEEDGGTATYGQGDISGNEITTANESGFSPSAGDIITVNRFYYVLAATGVLVNNGSGYAAGVYGSITVDDVDATTQFSVGDVVCDYAGNEVLTVTAVASTTITFHGATAHALADDEQLYRRKYPVEIDNVVLNKKWLNPYSPGGLRDGDTVWMNMHYTNPHAVEGLFAKSRGVYNETKISKHFNGGEGTTTARPRDSIPIENFLIGDTCLETAQNFVQHVNKTIELNWTTLGRTDTVPRVAYIDPYQSTEDFARVLLYDTAHDREFIAMHDIFMQVQTMADAPTINGDLDGDLSYEVGLDVANGKLSENKKVSGIEASEFMEAAYGHGGGGIGTSNWFTIAAQDLTAADGIPFTETQIGASHEHFVDSGCIGEGTISRTSESACCPTDAANVHQEIDSTTTEVATTFDTPDGTRAIPAFLALKGIRSTTLDLSAHEESRLQHLPQWTQMDFVRRLTVDLGEVGVKEGVTDIEAAAREVIRLINQGGALNGRSHERRPNSQYLGETARLDLGTPGVHTDRTGGLVDPSAPHLHADLAATGSTHDPAPFWDIEQAFASHDRGSHMGYIRSHIGRVVTDRNGNEGFSIVIHSTVPGASGRNFCVWMDNSRGQSPYNPEFLIGHGGRFRNFWCQPDEMLGENMHPAPMPINRDGRPFAPVTTLSEIIPEDESNVDFNNPLTISSQLTGTTSATNIGANYNANISSGRNNNTVFGESFESGTPNDSVTHGLRIGKPARARINFGGLAMSGVPGFSPIAGKWGFGQQEGDDTFRFIYGETVGSSISNLRYTNHVPSAEREDEFIENGQLYGWRFTDHRGDSHTLRMAYRQFGQPLTNNSGALPSTLDDEIIIYFDDRDVSHGGFTIGRHMYSTDEVTGHCTNAHTHLGNLWNPYPSPDIGISGNIASGGSSGTTLTITLDEPYNGTSYISHSDILGYLGFPDAGVFQIMYSSTLATVSYTHRTHVDGSGTHTFSGCTFSATVSGTSDCLISPRINWTTLMTDELIAAAVEQAINLPNPNSSRVSETSFDCREMYAGDGRTFGEWGVTKDAIRISAYNPKRQVQALSDLFEVERSPDYAIQANVSQNFSFTDVSGDTNSNTTVTVDSTSPLVVGMTVTSSASNIPAGTTIASITDYTTFVLSASATSTASCQLTFSALTDAHLEQGKRLPAGYLPETVMTITTKFRGINSNTATPVLVDSQNNPVSTEIWKRNLQGTIYIDTPGDLILPKIENPTVKIDNDDMDTATLVSPFSAGENFMFHFGKAKGAAVSAIGGATGWGERKRVWLNETSWALVDVEWDAGGHVHNLNLVTVNSDREQSADWATLVSAIDTLGGSNDGYVSAWAGKQAMFFDGLRTHGSGESVPLLYFRGGDDSPDHSVPLYFGGGFSGAVLDINDGTPNDYSSFYTHPYAAGPTGSAGLQNIGEVSTAHCTIDCAALLAMFPGTPYLDQHKGQIFPPLFNQDSLLSPDITRGGGWTAAQSVDHPADSAQSGTKDLYFGSTNSIVVTVPVTVPSPVIMRFPHQHARYNKSGVSDVTTYIIFGPGQAFPHNFAATEPQGENIVTTGNLFSKVPLGKFLPNELGHGDNKSMNGVSATGSHLPPTSQFQASHYAGYNFIDNWSPPQGKPAGITQFIGAGLVFGFNQIVTEGRYFGDQFRRLDISANASGSHSTSGSAVVIAVDADVRSTVKVGYRLWNKSTSKPIGLVTAVATGPNTVTVASVLHAITGGNDLAITMTPPPSAHPLVHKTKDGTLGNFRRDAGIMWGMDGGYHPGGHFLDGHVLKNPTQPISTRRLATGTAASQNKTAFRISGVLATAYNATTTYSNGDYVVVDATRAQNAEEFAAVMATAINEFPGRDPLKAIGGTFLPSFQTAHKQDRYGWIELDLAGSEYDASGSTGTVQVTNPIGATANTNTDVLTLADLGIPPYGQLRLSKGGNHGSIVTSDAYAATATGLFGQYRSVEIENSSLITFKLAIDPLGIDGSNSRLIDPLNHTVANSTTVNGLSGVKVYIWSKSSTHRHNNQRPAFKGWDDSQEVNSGQDHMAAVHFSGLVDAVDRTRPIGAVGWHGERYSYLNTLAVTDPDESAQSITGAAAITGITEGARITIAGHGYSEGDVVYISGNSGISNDYFVISNETTNTFDIPIACTSGTGTAIKTGYGAGLGAWHGNLGFSPYGSALGCAASGPVSQQTAEGITAGVVDICPVGLTPRHLLTVTYESELALVAKLDRDEIKCAGDWLQMTEESSNNTRYAGTIQWSDNVHNIDRYMAPANAGPNIEAQFVAGQSIPASGSYPAMPIVATAVDNADFSWHAAISDKDDIALIDGCEVPTGDLFWDKKQVPASQLHESYSTYGVECTTPAETTHKGDPLNFWTARSAARNFTIEHAVWKRMDGGNLTMPAPSYRGMGSVPRITRVSSATAYEMSERIYGNNRFSFETTNNAMFPIIQAQEFSSPHLAEQYPYELRNVLNIPNEETQFQEVTVTDDTGQIHTLQGGSPFGTVIRDFDLVSDRESEGLAPALAGSGISPNMRIRLPHQDEIPGNIVVRSGFDRIQAYQNESMGTGGLQHPSQPQGGITATFDEGASLSPEALGPRAWPTYENKGWEHISQDTENISTTSGKGRLGFPDVHKRGWNQHTNNNPLETAYEPHDRALHFHITKMGHTSTKRTGNVISSSALVSQSLTYTSINAAGTTITVSGTPNAAIWSITTEDTRDNRWFARVEDSDGKSTMFSYTGVGTNTFTGVVLEDGFSTFVSGKTGMTVSPCHYVPAGTTRFFAAKRVRDHSEVSGQSPDMPRLDWSTTASVFNPDAFFSGPKMTAMPIPRMGHHFVNATMAMMPGHFAHPAYQRMYQRHHACRTSSVKSLESDTSLTIGDDTPVRDPFIWFSGPTAANGPSDIHGGGFSLMVETKVAYEGYGIAASIGTAGAVNKRGGHLVVLEASGAHTLRSHFPDPLEVGAYQIIIQPNMFTQQFGGFHLNNASALLGPSSGVDSGSDGAELTGQQANTVIGLKMLATDENTNWGAIALILAEPTMVDVRGCEIIVNEVMLDIDPDPGSQFLSLPTLALYNPYGVNETASPALSRRSLPYRPGAFDRATPGYTLTIPWWAIQHEHGPKHDHSNGFRHLEWHKPDNYYELCRSTYGAIGSQVTIAGYPSLFLDFYAPTSFTDATCDYNNDPTIAMDSTAKLVVGMHVSGTGIPSGSSVASITDATNFELSASTTGGSKTNQTLTFTGENVANYRLRSLNPHCIVTSALSSDGNMTVDDCSAFPVMPYYGEKLEYTDDAGVRHVGTYAHRQGSTIDSTYGQADVLKTVDFDAAAYPIPVGAVIRLTRPYDNDAAGTIFNTSTRSIITRLLPQTMLGSRDTNSLHLADAYLCMWHPNLGRPYTYYGDNASRGFYTNAINDDTSVDKVALNHLPEHYETVHYHEFGYVMSRGPFSFKMKFLQPEGDGDALANDGLTGFDVQQTGSHFGGFWPGGSRGGGGVSRLDDYGLAKTGWGLADYHVIPYTYDVTTSSGTPSTGKVLRTKVADLGTQTHGRHLAFGHRCFVRPPYNRPQWAPTVRGFLEDGQDNLSTSLSSTTEGIQAGYGHGTLVQQDGGSWLEIGSNFSDATFPATYVGIIERQTSIAALLNNDQPQRQVRYSDGRRMARSFGCPVRTLMNGNTVPRKFPGDSLGKNVTELAAAHRFYLVDWWGNTRGEDVRKFPVRGFGIRPAWDPQDVYDGAGKANSPTTLGLFHETLNEYPNNTGAIYPSKMKGTRNNWNSTNMTVADWFNPTNACRVGDRDGVGIRWPTVFNEDLLHAVSTPLRPTGLVTSFNTSQPPFGKGYIRASNSALGATEVARGISSRLSVSDSDGLLSIDGNVSPLHETISETLVTGSETLTDPVSRSAPRIGVDADVAEEVLGGKNVEYVAINTHATSLHASRDVGQRIHVRGGFQGASQTIGDYDLSDLTWAAHPKAGIMRLSDAHALDPLGGTYVLELRNHVKPVNDSGWGTADSNNSSPYGSASHNPSSAQKNHSDKTIRLLFRPIRVLDGRHVEVFRAPPMTITTPPQKDGSNNLNDAYRSIVGGKYGMFNYDASSARSTPKGTTSGTVTPTTLPYTPVYTINTASPTVASSSGPTIPGAEASGFSSALDQTVARLIMSENTLQHYRSDAPRRRTYVTEDTVITRPDYTIQPRYSQALHPKGEGATTSYNTSDHSGDI